MRIELHPGEIVPVFGMLRDGLLILTPDRVGFRTVKVEECEIVEAEKSSFWVERDGEWVFAEFFEPYFAANLANGAPREKFLVEGYHELFLREFPRRDLKVPKYYGNGLVRCDRCGRIFRPLSCLGVVRCNDRNCRSEMNNPFYDPERLKESIEWARLNHLAEYRNHYYCKKMQRYYPVVPSRAALLCERFSEWWSEWCGRHRRRGRER